VNEKGTEAAAATGIGMMTTALPSPEEPFHFVADRPFIYAITDRETGAILFLGKIVDPTS
jgi:serine protease inhibitor